MIRVFFSARPWLATLYLFSYLPFGTVLFAGTLAVLTICYVMNITWLGLPLLVGASVIVRGIARLERGRARLVTGPITPDYQPITGTGVLAQVRTRWRDPATWRDCAYLVVLWPALLAMDTAVLGIWLVVLAGVALPAWYWTANGSPVHTWVPNLGVALAVAVGCAVLALYTSRLVVGTAWLHARVARALLGPRVDPLADAKRMLAEPGPLTV